MLFRYAIAGLIGALAMAAQATAAAQGTQRPSIMDIPLSAAEKAGLAPALNHLGDGGNHIHVHPSVAGHQARIKHGLAAGQAGSVALRYNGGQVMNPKVTAGAQTSLEIYTIYWLPKTGKLRDGSATTMAGNYQSVNNRMAQLLMANHLANVATQYYQTSAASPFVNQGGLAGTYLDTAAYPRSACTDTATPGNCMTDSQLKTELTRAIGAAGWTPGPNKIFMMFTSSGQGSCTGATSKSCAYTQYCAYHSSYTASIPTPAGAVSGPVIYANMPYGNPAACQAGGQSTPNAMVGGLNYGPYADLVANVATHEIIEAITDPYGNGWYDKSGNEIGDKCAWNFGTNTYTSPSANQYYTANPYPSSVFVSGVTASYFEFQLEYSNAANAAGKSGCVPYYFNF